MQSPSQTNVPPPWSADISEIVLSPPMISGRVKSLAHQLSADYKGLELVLVVILKGSFMFAADLSRALQIPHSLEFIRASSYKGTQSSGEVKVDGMQNVNLSGKHVLIIEDIVDTGLTLQGLYQRFQGEGAKSVKCCALLEKDTERRRQHVPKVDYVAFTIPDRFVVGYGLDFDQRFRHLPFVGVYRQ